MVSQKDKNLETNRSAGHSGYDKSLTSKIASSAGCLAKALVQPSNGSLLEQTLTSSSATSSKTPNFPVRSSSSAGTAPQNTEYGACDSATRSYFSLSTHSGFRSISSQGDGDEELGNFMNDGLDFREANAYRYNAAQQPTSGAVNSTNAFPHYEFSSQPRIFGRINQDDGAEVRQLLSAPGCESMEDAFMPDETQNPDSAVDIFGENLSELEKVAVENLKSKLPEASVHRRVLADHPLNLRPDFEKHHRTSEDAETSHCLGPDIEWEEFRSFSELERGSLLQQWECVLNNYTDDVWGDLLPAVEISRSQIQQAKNSLRSFDSKAIQRLKLVLGHLSQTSISRSTIDLSPTFGGLVTESRSTLAQQKELQSHSKIRQTLSTQQGSRMQTTKEWHLQSKHSRNQPDEDDLQDLVSKFQCPWISCHQRFSNAVDLHIHSQDHTLLACPHISCGQAFAVTNDWVEHLRTAHDILKTSTAHNSD